jgi:hypothetical protein
MRWLIVICAGVTGILLLAEIGVVAGSRELYPDPFAQYEAIMPGQPSESVTAYPCHLYMDDASTAHCTFASKESPFDSVYVVYDHVVKSISFSVHPDSLHMRDLILCWGQPARLAPAPPLDSTHWKNLWWDNQRSALVALDRNSTYLQRIYYVSVHDKWESCIANR